jgi:CubicO group peptidase (beta-lactamase class C family)
LRVTKAHICKTDVVTGKLKMAAAATGTGKPTGSTALESDYAVPADITPVFSWADGFSTQDANRLRRAYSAVDFISGNDVTAFAYLNLSEVLNTMTVARGGAVADLVRDPIPEIAAVETATDLGSKTLGAVLQDPRSRLQALMVVHQGKVVFEAYPGMPPDMKHLWNSASKTITGLAIYQLQQAGKIDLHAPVSRYLDFTAGSPIGDIRIEDVLHQRSGLDFEENIANFQNPGHPLGRALGSSVSARGVPQGPGIKDIVTEVPAHIPPNTAFEYSSANTQILGFVIEEVTQKPWNIVVSDLIWSKAGMEQDGLLGLSSASEGLHGGAFASTLADFARYGMLFLPSWQTVARAPVVPPGYLPTVYDTVNTEIYDKGEQGQRVSESFGETGKPIGASYHWDAVFADGDLMKSGLGGQALYVSPETDTAVVYYSTTWQNSLALYAYARAIVNELFR